ncbi:hypothetical protein GC169_07390 [bacterium]|nr:hypothetical protein [bacterium]
MKFAMACVAAALSVVTALASASADEVWNSRIGLIEWETEAGDTAIFKAVAPNAADKIMRFYLPGLVSDTMGGRSTYTGYWISTDDQQTCEAELIAPDGTRSRTWGRMQLTFVNEGFPSDWTALTGDCFGELRDVLTGVTP